MIKSRHDSLYFQIALLNYSVLREMGKELSEIERGDAVPRHPAWLAQQSAEKALKAVLAFLQVEFPFTHNLTTLRDLVSSGWNVKQVEVDLERLSEYAVASRYPGDLPAISPDDAQITVREARRIVEAVRADLDAYLDR